MNFKAKRSRFAINNSQIKNRKHCKHIIIRKVHWHQENNMALGIKKKWWERCQHRPVDQEIVDKQPPRDFQLTSCFAAQTITKSWKMKVNFHCLKMFLEMRFLPCSNLFPHFYLIQTDFRSCKQDIKRMNPHTSNRWQFWLLKMSKFILEYLMFSMVWIKTRM